MKKGLIASFKGTTLLADGRRVPRQYKACEGVDMEDLKNKDAIRFELLTEDDEEGAQNLDYGEEILFTPPAVSNADSFNVLKFYQLSDEVLQSLRIFQSKLPQDERTHAALSGMSLPEFPFIPDEREDALINSNSVISSSDSIKSSILLIGRSGTGKTSIAVGRMWALYRHCHSESWAGGAYNQVFVTANRVLRDQVRKSFQGMKFGFTGVQEGGSEYPHTLRDVPEGMFPLFLTQGEFLKMLDGTLPEPFWKRNEDGSLQHNVGNAFHEEEGMLDEMPDEDLEYFSDDPDNASEHADAEPQPHLAPFEVDKRVEVDFEVFRTRIWPKLCNNLSKTELKNVSAASLFQEIHSYIKGSSQALRSVDGRLTREEYNELGVKMAPNFKKTLTEDLPGDRSGSRDFVFDLYLKYEDEKKELGGYDISDVVFHIWSQIAKLPADQRTVIHSIFVDETQDFTQAELALFVRVANDKNDMFFSGDTCQTITSGVGFRFEDLKSIFKYEADRQAEDLAAKAQSLPAALKVRIPEVNTLTVNYRTHNGILAAAAGIVDLLEFFFPQSIDMLPREQGFFDGPKPMLLSETAVDDAAVMIVGADRRHSQIEFGAHQVLLVRNQHAKDKLPAFFEGCLAMTILESKGLEFDDVFLWNFLTDSKAAKEWRLVFSFLIEQDSAERDRLEKMVAVQSDKSVAGMLRPLEFNEQAHQILCSELKHLYTAITRARVRVVIYDQDPANRAPLFYYLEKRHLCDAKSVLGQTSAQGLAVESSAEEWQVQGKNLMQRSMFHLAAKCFRKSGDVRSENEAIAQHLIRHVAPPLLGNAPQLVEVYLEAAERFMAAGNNELSVARCCYSAGVQAGKEGDVKRSRAFYDVAGSVFSWLARADIGNDLFLRRAIGCLRKAGSISAAVELLVARGRHSQALKLLRDERLWSQALLFLDSHHAEFAPEQLTIQRNALLHESASEHAVKASNPRNPRREASYAEFMRVVALMDEEDEELHLLMHGYKEELVERHIQRGAFVKAAKVLSADNRRVEAANILTETNPNAKETDFELATELLLAHAVQEQCSEDDRLKAVAKAQQLQARLGESSDRGLELFMARIDPDGNSKEARFRRLREACSQQEHALVHVLVEYELFCHANPGTHFHFADPERSRQMQERAMVLTRDVDSITTMLVANDLSNEVEHLRCEQVFGLRRRFGSCCISPARKAIMDWMLETDSAKDQQRAVVTFEDDMLIDVSLFVSALRQYLLQIRKNLINKAVLINALTLNSALTLVHVKEEHVKEENALPCLLLLAWIIADTRNRHKERGTVADLERVEVGDLVQLKGLTRKQHNGELALVKKKTSQPPLFSITVTMAAGGTELTLNAQNATPLFSKTGLFNALAALEHAALLAVERLQSLCLQKSIPTSFDQQSRNVVNRALFDHVMERFSKWIKMIHLESGKYPVDKRSARALSEMLVTLELMTGSSHSDASRRLLVQVNQLFKQRRLSSHRFSELLKSQGCIELKKPEFAMQHKMLHLQAHLKDPPVDCMRDVVRAMAIAVLDLGRLSARNAADVVKLCSTPSSALLPATVARDLDTLRLQSANPAESGDKTLVLALQNLSVFLEDARFRERMPPSTSATLFQMVSAISLNFVVSHAPDFPNENATRSVNVRWSKITEEIWVQINSLTERILSSLDFVNNVNIKWLNVPVARCGPAGLLAPDPMDVLENRVLFSPWVVMSLVHGSDKGRRSSTYMEDQSATISEADVATWWGAGVQILERKAAIAANPNIFHTDEESQANQSEWESERGARALNASAEPFIPPSHAQVLLDLERLDQKDDLEAARERTALSTIARFFKRRLDMTNYHGERELDEKRAVAKAATSLVGGDAQEAEIFVQQPDAHMRRARYQRLHETPVDTHEILPRTTWNGPQKVFDEGGLGGAAQYDFVKSR